MGPIHTTNIFLLLQNLVCCSTIWWIHFRKANLSAWFWKKTALEEADSRKVIHVKDNILLHNNRKIAIRFSDSDVVVIMVSIMTQSMEYETDISVVIEFGSKESRRFIDINACYEYIRENISLTLPFFLCFFCLWFDNIIFQEEQDMSVQFLDELTSFWCHHRSFPRERSNDYFLKLEAFVSEVYGRGNVSHDLNTLRCLDGCFSKVHLATT